MAVVTEREWAQTKEAAGPLNVQLHSLVASDPAGLPAAFAEAKRQQVQAIVQFDVPFLTAAPATAQTFEFALTNRLPVMFQGHDCRPPGRPDRLRCGRPGAESSGGWLRRPNPQGGQGGRSARGHTREVPAARQPENRQGHRPDDPAFDPVTGRHRHRVSDCDARVDARRQRARAARPRFKRPTPYVRNTS